MVVEFKFYLEKIDQNFSLENFWWLLSCQSVHNMAYAIFEKMYFDLICF